MPKGGWWQNQGHSVKEGSKRLSTLRCVAFTGTIAQNLRKKEPGGLDFERK